MTQPQSDPEGLPRYDTEPCPGPGPHGVTSDCEICAGLGVVPAADTPNPVWPEVLAMLRKPLSTRLWESASKAIIFGSPVDIAMFSALTRRQEEARELLRRGTTEPWVIIKQRIWERDEGKCGVCGVNLDPGNWRGGHLVDRRACGGSDQLCNLKAMCRLCDANKPYHETLDQFYEWAARSGPWQEHRRKARQKLKRGAA